MIDELWSFDVGLGWILFISLSIVISLNIAGLIALWNIIWNDDGGYGD